MRRSKYDKYRDIYEQLMSKFQNVSDSKLKDLLASWETSFAEMDEWLADPQKPVTKSMLATGLEQGLMDTYYLISELSSEYRSIASKAFVDACSEYDQGFLDKIDDRCNKILSKGKIRNESEWHLVRSKVDELTLQKDEANLEQYQKLLDDFEFKQK